MGLSDLWSVLQTCGPVVGPALVVLIFFLWKDWRREDRLQGRIEKLEQDQKEIMLPMIEKCADVIAKNTAVMLQVGTLLTRYVRFESQDERKIFDQLIEDAEQHRNES
jgi:hypothetical protein